MRLDENLSEYIKKMRKLAESLNEANDVFNINDDFDDIDYDESDTIEFGESEVKSGEKFDDDYIQYRWNKPFSDIVSIDNERYQVWSANEIETGSDDTIYFVVDIDTSFIEYKTDDLDDANDYLLSLGSDIDDEEDWTEKSDDYDAEDDSYDLDYDNEYLKDESLNETILSDREIRERVGDSLYLCLLENGGEDSACLASAVLADLKSRNRIKSDKKSLAIFALNNSCSVFYIPKTLDGAADFIICGTTCDDPAEACALAMFDKKKSDELAKRCRKITDKEQLNKLDFLGEELDEDLEFMLVPENTFFINGADLPSGSVEDCARSVMAAYLNANKWLDSVKEAIYTKMSCPFFSSYVHTLAHTMPGRFDKFGDILHTVNIEIPYPSTQELESIPVDITSAFNVIFNALDEIKNTLNIFIKATDDNYHGMSCAAEALLNDIESEYPMLYRLRDKWQLSNGDMLSFDKFVCQYIDHKKDLLESLSETTKPEYYIGESQYDWIDDDMENVLAILKLDGSVEPIFDETDILDSEKDQYEPIIIRNADLVNVAKSDLDYDLRYIPEIVDCWVNWLGKNGWSTDLDECLNERLYNGYDIKNENGHYMIYKNDNFVESADTFEEALTIVDNLDECLNEDTSYLHSGWDVSADLIKFTVVVAKGNSDGDAENGMTSPDTYAYMVDAIDEKDAARQIRKSLSAGDGIIDIHVATSDELNDYLKYESINLKRSSSFKLQAKNKFHEVSDIIEDNIVDILNNVANGNIWKYVKSHSDLFELEVETDKLWDGEFWDLLDNWLEEHPLHLEFEVLEKNEEPGNVVYYYGKISSRYSQFDDNGAEWGYTYESLAEDTIKAKDGKWTNRGDEGTHGKFRTKKEADNLRKAMFAGGYKG